MRAVDPADGLRNVARRPARHAQDFRFAASFASQTRTGVPGASERSQDFSDPWARRAGEGEREIMAWREGGRFSLGPRRMTQPRFHRIDRTRQSARGFLPP